MQTSLVAMIQIYEGRCTLPERASRSFLFSPKKELFSIFFFFLFSVFYLFFLFFS